jgi:hypothetical protein
VNKLHLKNVVCSECISIIIYEKKGVRLFKMMDSFWKSRSTNEVKLAHTETSAKLKSTNGIVHKTKIDVDDYFALDSLVECSHLEEDEIFLKEVQNNRKQRTVSHRVVRSLGERIQLNLRSFTETYTEVNTNSCCSPDSRSGECAGLLLRDEFAADHCDNSNKHFSGSQEDSGNSGACSRNEDLYPASVSQFNSTRRTEKKKKNREEFIFLGGSEDALLLNADIVDTNSHRCSVLTSQRQDRSERFGVREDGQEIEKEEEVEENDKALSDDNGDAEDVAAEAAATTAAVDILVDLDQDFSDLRMAGDVAVRTVSSFSPVQSNHLCTTSTGATAAAVSTVSGCIATEEMRDEEAHEEENMEKASATSSSFFLRPNATSVLNVARISQLLWRGSDAAQKYLQISKTSPGATPADCNQSLWSLS